MLVLAISANTNIAKVIGAIVKFGVIRYGDLINAIHELNQIKAAIEAAEALKSVDTGPTTPRY